MLVQVEGWSQKLDCGQKRDVIGMYSNSHRVNQMIIQCLTEGFDIGGMKSSLLKCEKKILVP